MHSKGLYLVDLMYKEGCHGLTHQHKLQLAFVRPHTRCWEFRDESAALTAFGSSQLHREAGVLTNNYKAV